jgi:hypothetical protein
LQHVLALLPSLYNFCPKPLTSKLQTHDTNYT